MVEWIVFAGWRIFEGWRVVLGKVELVLGFKQSMARMHDPEGDQKDAEFQRVKNEIINQHRYVCAGCGLRQVRLACLKQKAVFSKCITWTTIMATTVRRIWSRFVRSATRFFTADLPGTQGGR